LACCRISCKKVASPSTVIEETTFLDSGTGWPDWANFRLMGDCLLWKFYENCRSSPHFWATSSWGKVRH
jgi:hypothetical protein